MTERKQYAVIVAGGKGLRMGGEIPKQFLPVGGEPVLMRTIRAFRRYNPNIGIVLVLPRQQQDYWLELCRKCSFEDNCTVVDGGETRFHSVRNALAVIPDSAEGEVAVHDGVRPFPSAAMVDRVFREARRTGAAVPVVPVVDTLRRVSADDGEDTSVTVARSEYRIVQTPQAFDIQVLKDAYRQEYTPFFTDDASVAEAAGHRIALVEGNRENIKITTPFDLDVAEAIVRSTRNF